MTSKQADAREALGARLLDFAPPGMTQAVVTRGVADAMLAAWGLAREHHAAHAHPERALVIAREGADHGTSALPLLRVSNTKLHRSGLSEWRLGQSRLAELEAAIQDAGPANVAMILLEPIQRGGGCLYAPAEYWPGVREICDRFGVLLAVDETVTGLGRLGAWFATNELRVHADLIVVAPGGDAAGAVLVHSNVDVRAAAHDADAQVAIAAMRHLDDVERQDLPGNVRRLAPHFAVRLAESIVPLPVVGDVRGAGFMWAVELEGPGDEVVVHLMPPLASRRADLDALVESLAAVLR